MPAPPCSMTDAIMEMAALYAKHKTPFVMGTTGGDREKLLRDTEVRARARVREQSKCVPHQTAYASAGTTSGPPDLAS